MAARDACDRRCNYSLDDIQNILGWIDFLAFINPFFPQFLKLHWGKRISIFLGKRGTHSKVVAYPVDSSS